ncbi:hypothetical protein ACK8HX_15745, partial [Oryzobacter sp. R7]
GWTARMMPGAVLEWTDPTGRVTTTHPQDALHGAVLPAPDQTPARPSQTAGEPASLGDTRSGIQLEHLLQRLPGATVWTRACPRDRRLSVLHARLAGRSEAAGVTGRRGDLLNAPGRRVRRLDVPPF